MLALGSPVFYFLVIGRALVGPYWDLFNPLFILAPVLYLVSRMKLDADLYIARGFLVGTATSLHYQSYLFGAFAAVILAFMIISSRKLNRGRSSVINGTAFGFMLSVLGVVIVRLTS